jgi:hypothetical protein
LDFGHIVSGEHVRTADRRLVKGKGFALPTHAREELLQVVYLHEDDQSGPLELLQGFQIDPLIDANMDW